MQLTRIRGESHQVDKQGWGFRPPSWRIRVHTLRMKYTRVTYAAFVAGGARIHGIPVIAVGSHFESPDPPRRESLVPRETGNPPVVGEQ